MKDRVAFKAGLDGTAGLMPSGTTPEGGDLRRVIEALRRGENDAALRAATSLLVATPDDPALCQLAALAAFRAGHHHEAKSLARRSLSFSADHGPTLLLFGRAARATGEDQDAVAAFRKAARVMPGHAEPRFLLCAMLLKAGDPEARVMLDDLLAQFPREAAGWEDIGQVLLDADKAEAALLCFARAERAAPRFGLAMRRGLILKDLGRVAEAAEAFAEAAVHDPRSARAQFLLGLSRQDLGDHAAAAAAYRRALDIDPALAEAAVNLGTVLQETGDLDGAKAAYARALAVRPDTFGRIAQAMTTSPKGELWLDLGELRRSFVA